MKNHLTVENVYQALWNPRLVRREVHRLLSLPFHEAYGRYVDRTTTSVDVMSRGWDNLFTLDACRADYFEAQHDFDESAERVVAPGKMSGEFMQETSVGKQFHDTVKHGRTPNA